MRNTNLKSLSAIQANNQQKTISIAEKLDVISWLKKGEKITEICCNVRSLILAYVQFMVMVIELQLLLSQKLNCLC